MHGYLVLVTVIHEYKMAHAATKMDDPEGSACVKSHHDVCSDPLQLPEVPVAHLKHSGLHIARAEL